MRHPLSSPLRILLPVVAIGVGTVAFWLLVPKDASFGMFEQKGSPNIPRLLFSLLSTVAGVVLGSFYRQLRQMQAGGVNTIASFPALASNLMRSVDLWLGLAGAPIVYAQLP